MVKLKGILFFLLLFISLGLNAADWYVAADGDNGTGDGSSDSPWLTIAYAQSQASTGDNIHIGVGSFAGCNINKSVNLLGANANVDPAGSTADRGSGESVFGVSGNSFTISSNNVIFNGFKTQVMIIVTAKNVSLKYNIFHDLSTVPGNYFLGFIYAAYTSNTEGLYVGFNTFYNASGRGIYAGRYDNQVIEYNHILNTKDETNGTAGKAIAIGYHLGNNIEVRYNTITDVEGVGINYWAGPNAEIHHNTISNTDGDGIFVSGDYSGYLDLDIHDNTISYADYTSHGIDEDISWGINCLQRAEIYDNTVSYCKAGINISYDGTSTSDRCEVRVNTIGFTKFAGINVLSEYGYVYNNTLNDCNHYGHDDSGDFDYASIHVDAGADHAIIDNNDVSDGISGIQTWSDYVTITNNEIYNMGLTYEDYKDEGDRYHYNSAILIGFNFANTCDEYNSYQSDPENNPFPNNPTNLTIENNNLHNNYYGIFRNSYLAEIGAITAEDNYFGDAAGPGAIAGTDDNPVSGSIDYIPWWTTSAMNVSDTESSNPHANDDYYSVNQASSISINSAEGVFANDWDHNVETSTSFSLVSSPSHSVAFNFNTSDGSFTYEPDDSWYGTEEFTYKTLDGAEESNTATVYITVYSNDPPVAVNDQYNCVENGTIVKTGGTEGTGVISNDEFSNPGNLTVTLESDAEHGNLTLQNSGGFEYSPDWGYTGFDQFSYIVNDGYNDSEEGIVYLYIYDSSETGPVKNVTKSTYHASISAAISAASNYDEIYVRCGEYNTGEIDVSREGLKLYGFSHDEEPGDRTSRNYETVINGWFDIWSDRADFEINGFKITGNDGSTDEYSVKGNGNTNNLNISYSSFAGTK